MVALEGGRGDHRVAGGDDAVSAGSGHPDDEVVAHGLVAFRGPPEDSAVAHAAGESGRQRGFLRRAVRRLGGPRVLGPRVARVAAAQLLAHLGVRALPEAAQVARRLDGPAVRREQLEDDRHLPRADPRRLGEAEQLLQLRRRDDRAVLAVVERPPCGRWAAASRSGARRSRRARVPGSSQRSGSSSAGRLVRPRQARERPPRAGRLRGRRRGAAAAAARPPPRARAARGPPPGGRPRLRDPAGTGRSPSSEAVVPVLRERPDGAGVLVEAVRDLACARPRATRARRGSPPARSAPTPAPATPPVTSSATQQIALAHAALPPEERARRPSSRTSRGEPGSRRRATRSGKPASSARQQRLVPVPSSRGTPTARSRGSACRRRRGLVATSRLLQLARAALTPGGASRRRSAAESTSESVVGGSPRIAGRQPSPSTAHAAAARAPPPATSRTRARRGCSGSRCMASPSGVSRPPDTAPSRSRRRHRRREPSRGRRLEPLERPRRRRPTPAPRGAGPARSTRSISGSRRGRRRSRASQSRTTRPGPVRPARPARCSAESAGCAPARAGRARAPGRSAAPCAGPSRSRRSRPRRSATSRRRSSRGSPCARARGRERDVLLLGRERAVQRQHPRAGESAASSACARRISGAPGRKHRTCPPALARTARTASARRQRAARTRPRPGTDGPAPRSPGSRRGSARPGPASSVADITSSRRSSRARHACRAKASARSACRLRSWNSSSTIVRKPLEQRVRLEPPRQDALGRDEQARVAVRSAARSAPASRPPRRASSPAPRRCAARSSAPRRGAAGAGRRGRPRRAPAARASSCPSRAARRARRPAPWRAPRARAPRARRSEAATGTGRCYPNGTAPARAHGLRTGERRVRGTPRPRGAFTFVDVDSRLTEVCRGRSSCCG